VAQLVECPPGKHEALSSDASTINNKTEKKIEEKRDKNAQFVKIFVKN
jgi:hypothetical protein